MGILVVAPLAGAWSGLGTYEPSTKRDITDNWMTLTTDVSSVQSVNKVYFSGWLSVDLLAANPNVGAAQTSITPPEAYSVWAMMGAWKDCNKDGYVGDGEQGLWEYRNELLLDKTVCPVVTTPTSNNGQPPLNWFPSHNDGAWVREWLSINWLLWNYHNGFPGAADVNPYNVNDNSSRVWMDGGLPESVGGGGGCWINPQPRGTYHSTGGPTQHADGPTGC